MVKHITEKAYAKINLFLDVGEKRPDGYHNVISVMQSIDLYDVIEIECDKESNDKVIKVCCEKSDIDGENNVMYKAAKAFFDYNRIDNYNIKIELTKNIPMQAGLGGGSADAGCVIRVLDSLYSTRLNDSQFHEIGMKVGSDVPFCITGGTCTVLGKGELVTRIDNIPDCYVVVAMPNGSKMSTAEAYKKIDELDVSGSFENMTNAISKHDIDMIANGVFNKFEYLMESDSPSMIVRKKMKENGANTSMMSGSGTAVFAICDDEEKAKRVAKSVENISKVFVCKPINF
ncbi:MAG: 4-(cytidine 5'-diphospho)-2-C-methyl-D-erythritol kinase [Clostridia bacterium]|nr:4-(cytidine 5'-diphospho)-2-C-methyl-D-erythritol kinase [Clostridia bacterium]